MADIDFDSYMVYDEENSVDFTGTVNFFYNELEIYIKAKEEKRTKIVNTATEVLTESNGKPVVMPTLVSLVVNRFNPVLKDRTALTREVHQCIQFNAGTKVADEKVFTTIKGPGGGVSLTSDLVAAAIAVAKAEQE